MENNNKFMEKLLDGVEVEWKPLGEVCKFRNGFAFKSSLFKENGLPVIRITNVDGKEVDLNNTKYFSLLDYKENLDNYIIEKGSILIAMSGATTGKIGYYNYDKVSYLNQRVGKFIPDELQLVNRFLYHFLLSKVEKIYILAGGGVQPNLSSTKLMEQLKVPIPCPNDPKKSLEIQREIVQILDNFTELTAELTAELQLRKKQYEYYRDELLSFEEGNFEWRKLKKIAKLKNGKDWKKLNEGNIPVYGTGGVMAYVEKFSYDKPTVLIPRKGSITNVFYLEEAFWNVDTIYYTEIDTKQIIPKYFYYFISNFDLMSLDTGSGRPSLTQAILNEIDIPIPFPNDPKKSLDEQQRIVSILDKFDTLTTSITDGLPKEIELRQKQYEYYRDMLFNFPRDNEKK